MTFPFIKKYLKTFLIAAYGPAKFWFQFLGLWVWLFLFRSIIFFFIMCRIYYRQVTPCRNPVVPEHLSIFSSKERMMVLVSLGWKPARTVLKLEFLVRDPLTLKLVGGVRSVTVAGAKSNEKKKTKHLEVVVMSYPAGILSYLFIDLE